jgi:hypothetical protein
MKPDAHRYAVISAALLASGVLLSGPVGLWIVGLVQPQPPWVDASVFVVNYSAVQSLPYYLGFLLIIGSVLVVSSTLRSTEPDKRGYMVAAIPLISLYSILISLNYCIQIAYVHYLATHGGKESLALLAKLPMSNPASSAWLLEMLGYAFQGLAFAALAFGMSNTSLDRLLRALLLLNAVISLLSPVLSVAYPVWVATTAGLVAFMFWNALVFVIALLFGIRARRQGNVLHAHHSN